MLFCSGFPKHFLLPQNEDTDLREYMEEGEQRGEVKKKLSFPNVPHQHEPDKECRSQEKKSFPSDHFITMAVPDGL